MYWRRTHEKLNLLPHARIDRVLLINVSIFGLFVAGATTAERASIYASMPIRSQ